MFRMTDCTRWSEQWWEELPSRAKLVLLYLELGDTSALSGCVSASTSRIELSTSLPRKEVLLALDELSDKNLIVREASAPGWLYLPGYCARLGAGKTFLISALRHAEKTPLGHLFVAEYGATLDTLSIPYRRPIDAPSMGRRWGTIDQDQDQDQDQDLDSASPVENRQCPTDTPSIGYQKSEEASPEASVSPSSPGSVKALARFHQEATRSTARRIWDYWRMKRIIYLPSCRPHEKATAKELDLICARLREELPIPPEKSNEWYLRRAIDGAYGDPSGLKWTTIQNIFRNWANVTMYYSKLEFEKLEEARAGS